MNRLLPGVALVGALLGATALAGCGTDDDPFGNQDWAQRPDFDNHHQPHTGTTVAACGSDNPVCFTVLGDLHSGTGSANAFATFDLINHEFGHCVTLAHGQKVTDAAPSGQAS